MLLLFSLRCIVRRYTEKYLLICFFYFEGPFYFSLVGLVLIHAIFNDRVYIVFVQGVALDGHLQGVSHLNDFIDSFDFGKIWIMEVFNKIIPFYRESVLNNLSNNEIFSFLLVEVVKGLIDNLL